MKERSQALLASAVLAASSAAASVAAEPPLKTLPLQQDIWITGTIQRGSGQYAPDDYTILRPGWFTREPEGPYTTTQKGEPPGS
jgi:hypothetical protein